MQKSANANGSRINESKSRTDMSCRGVGACLRGEKNDLSRRWGMRQERPNMSCRGIGFASGKIRGMTGKIRGMMACSNLRTKDRDKTHRNHLDKTKIDEIRMRYDRRSRSMHKHPLTRQEKCIARTSPHETRCA